MASATAKQLHMNQKSKDLVRLLERVAKGDRARFAELYAATSLKLYGIVLRISRREELAEEILQEVYIRIWERAGDYDPTRATPITWMAAIAHNRAIDEVRRRDLVYVDNDISQLALEDPAHSPAANAELSDDLKRLEACLAGLEPEQSEAIKLAYLAGCSRQELAERFGRPLGTIKTWLHRGLKQLKDCLGS